MLPILCRGFAPAALRLPQDICKTLKQRFRLTEGLGGCYFFGTVQRGIAMTVNVEAALRGVIPPDVKGMRK